MRHIPGIDRSQVLLLPEAVDDYVGRDNPVRFIDAFVDGLDLAAVGFERAAPKATGRPGYDPADLLKLYIYGYLNRVRSSRRLEAESKRNLEVIWLLRRLSPDFKTIADFRRINRAAFRQVFREFVRLCRELELFGRELVAVDGTRIKAVNSRKRNFTKAKLAKALAESDERLSRYLDRLDEADGQDEGGTGGGEVEHIQEKIAAIQGRRERFEEHRDALAASGEGQLSLTDPDSRAMHAETRVGVGYNIQIAVDAKHKLIAEQQVHNKVSDLGLLAETAVAARRNLAVDRIDAVADAGYFKIEDIEACENAGVMPHVPKPQRGSTVSQGLFPKERFRYDGGEDIYICPNGQRLALHSKRKRRDLFFASYANRAACKECQLKSKCTEFPRFLGHRIRLIEVSKRDGTPDGSRKLRMGQLAPAAELGSATFSPDQAPSPEGAPGGCAPASRQDQHCSTRQQRSSGSVRKRSATPRSRQGRSNCCGG